MAVNYAEGVWISFVEDHCKTDRGSGIIQLGPVLYGEQLFTRAAGYARIDAAVRAATRVQVIPVGKDGRAKARGR